MEAEIHENLKIGVGLIEQRPEAAHGHTLINTTWVYSTKLKDGEIVFKARLTARGDQEDPANINDDHRASPTADQDSIRLILAELANMPGAKLMSFDFVRAYLQARMPTDAKPIFVRVPAGFGKEFPGKIFLLGVNLYGLVEAAYRWYRELCTGMEELGWIRGSIDSCVWHKDTPSGPIYVAVHVDDGVMGGFKVADNMAALAARYKMTVQENPKELLGCQLEIPKGNHGLMGLHQTDYIIKLLDKWENHPELAMPTEGISVNPKRMPYNVSVDLRNPNGEGTEEDLPCWKSLAGDLQWINTRPEISFIVKELARATGHVTGNHKKAAHELLKYLRTFPSVCVTYGAHPMDSPVPTATVDSEHGYDKEATGRASHGYGVFCKGGLVAHKSATQPCASTSSCESEVIALSDAAKRAMKLRNYQRDRGMLVNTPSLILEDNKGAVDYARNPSVTRGMRHIAQRFHYARELQQMAELDIQHCPTEEMVADIFTKMVPYEKFSFCCRGLGMMPLAELKEFNRKYNLGEIDLPGYILHP